MSVDSLLKLSVQVVDIESGLDDSVALLVRHREQGRDVFAPEKLEKNDECNAAGTHHQQMCEKNFPLKQKNFLKAFCNGGKVN